MSASGIDLDEIEARANAATPGPWEWWTSNSWRRLRRNTGHGHTAPVIEPTTDKDGHPNLIISEADMGFVQNARADVPALIAEVRRLRAENAQQARRIETAIGLIGVSELRTLRTLKGEL